MFDFNISESLVSSKMQKQLFGRLKPYLKQLQKVVASDEYFEDESSIVLPSDACVVRQSFRIYKARIDRNLKYVVVIGIGGSNLGTKAVYDALYGSFDVLKPGRVPKLLFLDTNDSGIVLKLISFLKKNTSKSSELLINTISKSGGTTETIVNTEYLIKSLRTKYPDINDRLVVTSDEGSKLCNAAREQKISVLSVPQKVGGRYSVFSNVGVFPLLCVGIDVKKLLKGAKGERGKCLSLKLSENHALLSAIVLFSQYKKDKTIHDTFVFHPELESLGKWYRQLMGESIGKEKDKKGKRVHAGMTPTVSVGSADLHSVGQLYLGGPKDKVTTFVSGAVSEETGKISTGLFPGLVEGIKGRRYSEIMSAILDGVKLAYSKKKLPYMEISFDSIDEESIGAFMQFKMLEVMYLGSLMDVNVFDQPNVELYKTKTRELLK